MNTKTVVALVAGLLVLGLVIHSRQRSAAPAPVPAPTDSFPARHALKPRLPAPRLPAPQLAQLKQLSLSLADLAQAYRRVGDEASAQAALQIGLNLGQRLDDPQAFSLMQNLVGTAIQRNLLAT